MATKETTDVGDIQRRMLQPGWGQDNYKGERRLLYESLKEGEIIERLYECSWQSDFENHDPGTVGAVAQSSCISCTAPARPSTGELGRSGRNAGRVRRRRQKLPQALGQSHLLGLPSRQQLLLISLHTLVK